MVPAAKRPQSEHVSSAWRNEGVHCWLLAGHVGLQRESRRFITCVVDVRWVENLRVKLVYHPKVLELLRNDERCWIRTKEEADTWAAVFPEWQKIWEKPSP